MLYGCDDLVELYRNRLVNEEYESWGGYGILDYMSPPNITGEGYGDSLSRIEHWKYGLAVAGVPDTFIACVRDMGFSLNEYHVYVYGFGGSDCDLGNVVTDGHNYFAPQSCSTYTVYNESSETVEACGNFWPGGSADSCHPFTYGNINSCGEFSRISPLADEPEASGNAQVPDHFYVEQNHPNPFNLGTQIQFGLPEACHVGLHIYDILGRRVMTLLDNDFPAGIHAVFWDGKDRDGKGVATGMYFYRIEAGNRVETKKMIIIK